MVAQCDGESAAVVAHGVLLSTMQASREDTRPLPPSVGVAGEQSEGISRRGVAPQIPAGSAVKPCESGRTR